MEGKNINNLLSILQDVSARAKQQIEKEKAGTSNSNSLQRQVPQERVENRRIESSQIKTDDNNYLLLGNENSSQRTPQKLNISSNRPNLGRTSLGSVLKGNTDPNSSSNLNSVSYNLQSNTNDLLDRGANDPLDRGANDPLDRGANDPLHMKLSLQENTLSHQKNSHQSNPLQTNSLEQRRSSGSNANYIIGRVNNVAINDTIGGFGSELTNRVEEESKNEDEDWVPIKKMAIGLFSTLFLFFLMVL